MNQLAYPYALFLLLLPFVWRAILPIVKGLHGDALRVPFIKDIELVAIKAGSLWSMGNTSDNRKYSKLFWIIYVIWALLTIAIARPQWVGEPIRLKNYSRDILLIMDISNSMLERDFAFKGRQIDRLSAVKAVASEFIGKRTDDRMGLILFGTRAYLQAPLTYDKQSVNDILWSMDAGMAGDSTAIGDALGLALKTLKDAPNLDNKMIILLTDGESNDGSMPLAQAIKLAKEEKIKTYTIGVGAPNAFLSSFFGVRLQSAQSALDEESLQELAAATKGTYFRAEDTSSLQKIYNTIDKMEPSLNENRFIQETKERYYIPLLMAILLGFGTVMMARKVA